MRYCLALLLISLSLPAVGEGRLRILLTNDDGFDSPGIQALHAALTGAGHDVSIIAPATQQSGASASISARGVRVTEHPGKIWAIHGRPADAVRVGLGYLMFDDPPDLVVSGANFGHNTGQDVNISGTVGAAITAHRLGVPALAVSVEIKLAEAREGFPSTVAAFPGAGRLLVRLIQNLDLDDLSAVLNINVPAVLPLDVRGVRWARLSEHSLLGKRYNKQPDGTYAPELSNTDQHNRKHDAESLEDGWVTLTFLDGDMGKPVHRSQKYLDRGLLDRNYEPVNPTAPRRQPQPAAQVVTPEPVPVRTAPEDDQMLNFETAEPAPAPQPATMKPVQPDTAPSTPLKPSTAPQQLDAEPLTHESVPPLELPSPQTEPTADPPESKAAEPVRQQPKRKPDSWLRRLFDPASWRG